MPLSDQQKEALRKEAASRGVDANALIAEAESIQSSAPPDAKSAPSADQPKLFMYLLSFVTVREVREHWLGLSESFPGDNEVASVWAAKQGAPTVSDPNAGGDNAMAAP